MLYQESEGHMFKLTSLTKTVRKFHENESGLEALQVVMIIAVAALCLLAIKYFWDTNIKDWVTNLINSITGWTKAN
jgi:Flp pilus assembly pilin Flp